MHITSLKVSQAALHPEALHPTTLDKLEPMALGNDYNLVIRTYEHTSVAVIRVATIVAPCQQERPPIASTSATVTVNRSKTFNKTFMEGNGKSRMHLARNHLSSTNYEY